MKETICVFLIQSCLAVQALAIANPGQLKLPPGFSIRLFAEHVESARQMAAGPEGLIFVGSRAAGKVYRISPSKKPGALAQVSVIDSGLKMPSGIAFHKDALYVADIDKIYRYKAMNGSFGGKLKRDVFISGLPDDRHHGWKFIGFGPDGYLYIPVGAPCNVCLKKDPRYASILRYTPDGTSWEVYASGIRNSVGFDWHPLSRTLWFTDNGRDMLGDLLPPDKLSHAWRKGLHFGFPYWHGEDQKGKAIWDKQFREDAHLKIEKPSLQLPAHVAPLGMVFYRGSSFPAPFRDRVLIPEHGSWNSSKKVGYRVSMATVGKDQKVTDYRPFITGWLKGEEHWGRPVALLNMPDGSLLLSDDYAHVIYRISYNG